MKKGEHSIKTIAARGGSYSAAVTAMVLAILIAVSILVNALPKSWTKWDISATRLYSVTSNTKAVVSALEEDVTIYWVVQADEEDSVLENLLEKYESLSGHISVVKKNPDVYPTFVGQYTDEEAANNSLIVESGGKSRYIAYDDIYLVDVDYTTYSLSYSFDGEGAITSAIAYVVSEELPKLYRLTGHGEGELPQNFSEQLEKENVEVAEFSLTQEDAVPEEADGVIIYAPETDISVEEKNRLADYVYHGGKLLVLAGTGKDGTLENLCGLLEDYGVEAVEGLVVEEDSSRYAFKEPLVLLPEMTGEELTAPLVEDGYRVILPLAQGLRVTGNDFGTVTTLLESSESAFSKTAGYQLTSYEKEEGDEEGPFALGVKIESTYGGEMIWISSSYLLTEGYNAYSSGGNLNLVMNGVSQLVGESESLAIRSKSLGYNYLTISEENGAFLKVWLIGLVPGCFVVYGLVTVVDRRRKRK